MPLRLFYLPSYERCLKQLGHREQQIAGLVVSALQSYFDSGLPIGSKPFVFEAQGRSYRLVFKKLRDQIWEAYVEGQIRVLTRFEDGSHFLAFAGNHDQVRKFLRKA